MSLEARHSLVNRLVFQRESQRDDLLNMNLTQTQLIALLLDLVNEGHHIEITAVRSDHSDDAYLGFHCHAHGFCADLWPLASSTPGDYLDASDSRFAKFLHDAAQSEWLHQVGLAGSSWSQANVDAAGPTVFHDDGADHIHLGAS